MAKSCATCRFWDSFDEPNGERFEGFCRYNPPGFLNGDEGGAWPITHRKDWCGSWGSDSAGFRGEPAEVIKDSYRSFEGDETE